jgi:hypothetical protein
MTWEIEENKDATPQSVYDKVINGNRAGVEAGVRRAMGARLPAAGNESSSAATESTSVWRSTGVKVVGRIESNRSGVSE